MTHTQALEVKELLMRITDHIPANLVDPIFNYYTTYIAPGAGKPCTCNPRYWNDMLNELKNKVEVTLASYEEKIDQSSTISKRGRKKRNGTTV